MLLSESSAAEKRAFLPLPFFPYLFLLSFPVPSSYVSSFTTVVLSGCFLGPALLLVSHVCLGFTTSRCLGTIDIAGHSRVSDLYPMHARLALASCQSNPSLSIPFCPYLLLLFFLGVWSPCCLKLVSVLLSINCSSFWARLDAKFSLFSICVRACFPPCLFPLFSPGSILNFVPNHCYSSGCLGKNWLPGLLSLFLFFSLSRSHCLSLNCCPCHWMLWAET